MQLFSEQLLIFVFFWFFLGLVLKSDDSLTVLEL